MKLTSAQIREYADAVDAFAAGKPVEFLQNGEWHKETSSPRAWGFKFPRRPAPAPTFAPWDFNSRPREVVWVYRNGHITDSQIVAWGDDVVAIATKHGLLNCTYLELFHGWRCRDGSPCGVQVNPSKPAPFPPCKEPTEEES